MSKETKASRFIELVDTTARSDITAPLPSAWTLPPAAYTDAALFSEEIEMLFLRDWICVARTEQVENSGDYLCVDLPNTPLILSRDLGGSLHALSRICIHRAMPLAEGNGTATRFVCPYHKWTYELDGQLRSAPMMQEVEGFSAEACKLPELKLEVWNGFVFVNADPEAAPLAPQLSGLDALIQNYDFEALEIADSVHFPSSWNWKILVENFMEAYHHIGTHAESLEPNYRARQSHVPDNQGEPWAFLDMPGEAEADPTISSFPSLTDTERKRLFAAAIFPTFLFAGSNEMGIWYQLQPSAHDQMDLRIHILLHPQLLAALSPDDLANIRNQVIAVHEEDIGANLGTWRGLHSPLSKQGRLSAYEKAIWQINQYWVQRLEARP